MTRLATFLLMPALVAVGACASAPVPAPACPRGQQAMTAELLYFGTAMPQGSISAEDWRAFVDEVVTPRFPDGLTYWAASGQWKSPAGALVREPSYVLDIVHAPDLRSDVAIAEIVDGYKKRFQQESVLRVSSAACVAF